MRNDTVTEQPSLLIVQIFAGLALCALLKHVVDCASSVWAWNTWVQLIVYVIFLAHYVIDDVTHKCTSRLPMHPLALMTVFVGWAFFAPACMTFGVRPLLSGILTCAALVCFTGLLLREYAEQRATHLARSIVENLLFLLVSITMVIKGNCPETLSPVGGFLWLLILCFMLFCLWWRCHDARKGKE